MSQASPRPPETASAASGTGGEPVRLVDTPGLHKARTRLGDYMINVVKESVSDVDAVLLLVEPIPHVGSRRSSSLPG